MGGEKSVNAPCYMLNSALQINGVLIDFCVKFPISHHLHQLSTCVQSQSARLSEKGVEMQQRRVNGQKTFLAAFMIRHNPVGHAFCTGDHIQFIDANQVHSMPILTLELLLSCHNCLLAQHFVHFAIL